MTTEEGMSMLDICRQRMADADAEIIRVLREARERSFTMSTEELMRQQIAALGELLP